MYLSTVTKLFYEDRCWSIITETDEMNTIQLTAVMDKITRNTYFLGGVPCDYLPKTPLKNLPAMVIFNTDPSTEQHWVAIYINSNGVSCFFDSFWGAPKDPRFPKSLCDKKK